MVNGILTMQAQVAEQELPFKCFEEKEIRLVTSSWFFTESASTGASRLDSQDVLSLCILTAVISLQVCSCFRERGYSSEGVRLLSLSRM